MQHKTLLGGYYIVYLNLTCVTIWNAMATSLRCYEQGLYDVRREYDTSKELMHMPCPTSNDSRLMCCLGRHGALANVTWESAICITGLRQSLCPHVAKLN